MGFADVEDLFRRSGCDELSENFPPEVVFIFDLGVEFAVREGAGPAFAKLDVRFGVQFPLFPKTEGVCGAFPHGFASFEDDGGKAHLRE